MTQPNAGFRWPQLVAAPSSQAAVEGAPPDLTTATVARRAIAPLSMHERIVAIVAPVGYGKTTLMGGWFRACKDADPVWVGLDASWRDQVFFVRSLLNAIGGPSEPVAMGAIDAAAVVESGLLALLQALGQRRRPMMLFCAAMPGLCAPVAGRTTRSGPIPLWRRTNGSGLCAQMQLTFHRGPPVLARGASEVRGGSFAFRPHVGAGDLFRLAVQGGAAS
jgi:hypothetical protein